LGYVGAIVNSSEESVTEKVVILKDAGIIVATTPSDMCSTETSLLKGR